MVVPRWGTIGLFVSIIVQFILSWARAKKTEKSFRAAVLPSALMAIAVSMIFVRFFFEEVPVWVDAPLLIFCFLLISIVLALWIVQFRRYSKNERPEARA